ncbi:unnamed protein product [Phytophthora fragariaefolia]|uniref:Unnamed protein product n=1 Tax=Phytophthora fragariaefolia TaxID=1490495 RepID=A0A9W6TXM6_9STRA|nr:unnamed protein product [Phytophthora fragariaefolia]
MRRRTTSYLKVLKAPKPSGAQRKMLISDKNWPVRAFTTATRLIKQNAVTFASNNGWWYWVRYRWTNSWSFSGRSSPLSDLDRSMAGNDAAGLKVYTYSQILLLGVAATRAINEMFALAEYCCRI